MMSLRPEATGGLGAARVQPGRGARRWVVAIVFLGWMFAGMEMALMVPTARPAIRDFIASRKVTGVGTEAGARGIEQAADEWFSWYLVAFLLGAACGGVSFGWLGDRVGRVRAMGWSIVTYSGWTALSYYAQTPEQLWGLRFLACLGVGGMWPSGVALAAEAWPQTARPVLAGLIGTAANVGFLVLGLIMWKHPVTQASWRWVMLLGGAPLLLAPIVFWTVAESPRWLETRRAAPPEAKRVPVWVILQAPLLRRTALGVALGTIPMLGGWASGQRLVPWAGQVAEQAARPQLQGHTQIVFAAGAVAGSLIGGWIAHRLGPRLSYFLLSLGSLVLSVGIFVGLRPGHDLFLWAACLLGAVSTSYFGWLPYFLPDLFPTSVRATGTGTAYNLGRLVSAAAVLASAGLSAVFAGDIGRMGAATSWVYALGLVLAWMVPAGGVRPLDETSGERKGLREGATK